ncbi:Suppressor of fused protein (SUFU) [Tenacibaculum sp. MAR_2009_124]|uniref:suppressor of fused domain protein n=1 Tax=Tenacibaculum sp. MAR_2009_124 TaxID=1250059 RepID=UPI0008978BA1|nr:suppressor of fused domain protein [Tenacibaculum sp. MAR_2009_124]SEC25700.1 Suppressor of fused protein (SUFU) [Tenacibaculum sp. MAR_2009_124]
MNYEEHFKLSCEKREHYWKTTGELFSDVVGNMINPSFMGGPRWPSLRQAHIGVQLENGTIIASDGLTDPYDDYDTNPENQNYNGVGIELYTITDSKYKNIQEIIDSWEFKVLSQVSRMAASNPNISYTLNDYTYISSVVNGIDLPSQFLNEAGEVGVLLGLKTNEVSSKIQLSIEEVSLVNVSILTKKELDFIMENGAKGRIEIAEKLMKQGYYKLSTNRKSVV